jgi:DNA-binding YbaB/EbfC family protein
MQKAQQMQKDMANLQEEIKNLNFDASVGGGLVNIVMNGNYEIQSLDIDDKIISIEDKSMLIDLIIASYNEVRRKVKETSESKMQDITSGLPLPAGMKLPGLF